MLGRIFAGTVDKVICIDKGKYTQRHCTARLEMYRDSQITISTEDHPSINFPWTSFLKVPWVEDYQCVHLCETVSDFGDVSLTQIGEARLVLRRTMRQCGLASSRRRVIVVRRIQSGISRQRESRSPSRSNHRSSLRSFFGCANT